MFLNLITTIIIGGITIHMVYNNMKAMEATSETMRLIIDDQFKQAMEIGDTAELLKMHLNSNKDCCCRKNKNREDNNGK